ncbi:MAG: response regulator [Planctomycetes bacterium]|nr:response regulator [Planctomycetota bacterium]
MSGDRILTTGDLARYCKVTIKTVLRWIEQGYLKSYKLPGRGDNRVPIDEFKRFLNENRMPFPEEFRKKHLRILVVDDEPRFSKSICRVLKREGYETQISLNGFHAGLLATTFAPDIILLDLKMPGLGGHEVIQNIREINQNLNVKILVISAMPKHEITKALELGADDYIEKPINENRLLQKITQLVSKNVLT